MADQIENFYRTAYVDNVRLGAMHMRSHLRESVDFEPSRGEYLMLDAYGEINEAAGADYLTPIVTRNGPNVETQMPRSRRRLAPKFWELTEYFDPRDRVKLLRDIRPDSNYSRAILGAFGRQMDRELIIAADANMEAEDGTPIAFTAANDVDRIVGDSTGANVDKLIEQIFKLMINKAQQDLRWVLWISPHQVLQLFQFTTDDRLLSQDFSGMHPLKSGQIGHYLGADIIPTTEIPEETVDALATRYSYALASDAMVFTMDGQVEVHFDIIADKRHALQVAHYGTFSACRMHEPKIIRAENSSVLA